MTPMEERRVWDIESRIDRQQHWYRVRVVFGLLGLGAVSLWALIELVVWASTRFAL